MQKDKVKQKSLLIEETLHTRIKTFCTYKGIKLSSLSKKIFEDYLDKNEHTIKKYTESR